MDMEVENLREQKRDFNQNLIEPSRLFEQLCDMINQLEKDNDIEIIKCNQMDTCINYDVNLEPPSRKCAKQIEPEKDVTKDKCPATVTTFENIMSFLKILENENVEVNNIDVMNNETTIIPLENPNRHVQNNHIFECQQDELKIARLSVEEKNATIECLKNQLKSERKAACNKITSQKRCHISKIKELENRYRTIVKRHQKFIEHLMSEKVELTQKCDSLAQKIKEMEQKSQRDIKTITERHAVELQRAKENIAASEKIRRERWLEMKTAKIKEMTVKGLEPELHNMMNQHQREMQELKRTHMKELQDVELCAIDRSNQQLEQLRLRLTQDHRTMLEKEKDTLVSRYEEKFDKQEAHFQNMQKTLAEYFENDKSTLLAEQKRRDVETSVMMQQMQLRFQKETKILKEQCDIAKKNLEESLKKEWLVWADNYKKQQDENFTKTKTTIHDDFQRERDKQIEIAIAKLEKESRDMREKLQQSFDNRLELLKEEYDAKLQSVIKHENIHKGKLLLLEEKLASTEIQLEKTQSNLKECTLNLNNTNVTITKLTVERDNAKEIARQTFETEKRELKEKVTSLYQKIAQDDVNKDQLLAQLYSRIKLIITQKILVIKNLNEKLNDANAKCEHLEKLLDQQRKEYILKTL